MMRVLIQVASPVETSADALPDIASVEMLVENRFSRLFVAGGVLQ